MKHFDLKTIVIVCLLGVILFQTCGKNQTVPGKMTKVDGKKYEVLRTVTDTEYIPEYETRWKKGDSIPFEVIVHDTVPAVVDTLSVLKEYYLTKVYTDTFKINYGQFRIKDTISQNKIVGRGYESDLLIPIQKEYTVVKELPKIQLYVGFDAAFNRVDGLSSFGPKLLIKSKKDQLYWIGAGIGLQGNPQVGVGMAWKVKLK